MEIQEIQEKVDKRDDNIDSAVKEYLDNNFDRLRYSVTFESVTIKAPRNSSYPCIEASFMSHQETISRNTIVRVYSSNYSEFVEVELMAGKKLWDEMRNRWSAAQPFNHSVQSGIKNRLDFE